jgi:hypothetical protein
MKSLKLTLLLVGSFLFSHAQEKTDLAKDRLKGKVRSVTSAGYGVDVSSGTVEKGRHIHTSTSKYNTKGYVTEFLSSPGDDTIEHEYVHFKEEKTTYKYDGKNNLIGTNSYMADGVLSDSSSYKVDNKGNRIDWFTFKGDGTLKQNYTTEYDNKGHMLESNEYFKNRLINRHTFKYDEKGNQVEENMFGSDGHLRWKETFAYDAKGNLVEVTDYKQNGSFDARFTYAYDAKGNQIEEKEFTSESSMKHKRILTKYDAEGNVIEVNQFNESGHFASQCKLDKRGNHLLDVVYNPDGTLQEKISQDYKYDDHGNEIEMERHITDGSLSLKNTYKYEYDKKGNWLKKISYENDKPTRITERVIEYY